MMLFRQHNTRKSELKGFQERKRKRALKRNALKRNFDLEINRVIPQFFSDDNQGLKINQQEIKALLDWIDQHSNGLDQKKFLNNYLASTLESNQQKKLWQCPKVARIFNLPREKNLFNPISFGKVNTTRDEVKIFESSITNPITFGTVNTNIIRLYKWGQILASAVFLGGVLNKNALVSIIFTPLPKLFKSTVQLTLFEDGNPRWLLATGYKRTWFIDPVTLQLLKDALHTPLQPISHETLNENIDWVIKALNNFFRLTAKSNGFEFQKITSISTWLESHQTRLALILPPYLLHYASGRHKATSLSEHTYLRLTQNKYLGIMESTKQDEHDNWMSNFKKVKSKKLVESQARLAEKEMRESLYVPSNMPEPSPHEAIAKLNDAISKHVDTAPDILIALATWITRKLDVNDREASNNGVTPRTAYDYFTSISGGLIEHLGSDQLSNYEIDHYIGTYEEILDSLNPNTSTKLGIAQRLRQFHRHLVLNHNVSPIDFQILDDDCFITAADANLITNAEYQQILEKLKNSDKSRIAKAITCIFILGYRCGLRINEVQNIRFCDIQLDLRSSASKLIEAPISLLIRNTNYNNLKTTESRRVLPLHLLIPKEELHIVLDYLLNEYSATKPDRNRAIFTSNVATATPIDRPIIYATLNPLMRAATKDGNIRFHHLRHSFANNLALGFLCSKERLELLYQFDFFYCDLKERLFSEHINKRSLLFQIASWMGHASPQTTLKSYIHVCDFLLADALYNYSYSIKKRGLGNLAIFYEDLNPSVMLSLLTDLPPKALLTKSNKQTTLSQFIANRPSPLKDCAANLKAYLPIPHEWSLKEAKLKTVKDMDISSWISFLEFLKIGKSYQDTFELLEIEKPDEKVLEQLLYSLFKPRINQRFKQSALSVRLESRKHTLQLSNKVIYLMTPPRGDFGKYIANQTYNSLLYSFKKKPNDVREFFKLYFEHFNFDHREIRFKRGEKSACEKFKSLANLWLPKEMLLIENLDFYEDSARYWSSIKVKPVSSKQPSGESAHAIHFAVLTAFICTKL